MKTKAYSLFAAMILGLSFGLTSCEDDKDDNNNNSTSDLQGNITKDVVIDGTATLKGAVHVKSGVTLTVREGSVITADASDLSYLLIEQGAKIIAEGSAAKPIVFTANSQEAGAWGGLHICGYAPINSGATGSSEIGEATYGGTKKDDNSGVLKYVRVEYSGTTLDPKHEANGISFYGVGNGTIVDYVQIYVGKDDGIEFFGGTVDIKHTVVYGAGDDSFDWTEGWSGRAQFLIAKQTQGGDRGIEGDNLGSNNTATPYADPILSNVTLIGDNHGDGYGMKLREGTKGRIYNVIVSNFDKRSIHVEHDQTLLNVVSGALLVDYAYVNSNVSDLAIKYSASENSSKPANLADHYFENSNNITLSDLKATANISTTYDGGMDLTSVDTWFDASTKIGAGSVWTSGWTKGL